MNSIKLPTWLRVVLVVGVFILATGAGLFAYRWFTKPVTLTIAVGSLDGEAGKVMSAIAGRLVSMDAPVRLKAIETGSALGRRQRLFDRARPIWRWFAAMSATCRRRRPSSWWPRPWRC